MVTARCLYCEHVREIAPNEQPWPFCADSECEDRFVEIVHALLAGGMLADFDIPPDSLLGKTAIAESKRIRFRMAREWHRGTCIAPGARHALSKSESRR